MRALYCNLFNLVFMLAFARCFRVEEIIYLTRQWCSIGIWHVISSLGVSLRKRTVIWKVWLAGLTKGSPRLVGMKVSIAEDCNISCLEGNALKIPLSQDSQGIQSSMQTKSSSENFWLSGPSSDEIISKVGLMKPNNEISILVLQKSATKWQNWNYVLISRRTKGELCLLSFPPVRQTATVWLK